MSLRHRTAPLFVAAALVLGTVPAFAAKPQPTPIEAPAGPGREFRVGAAGPDGPLCQMGVTGPPANLYGYIFGPDDGYYTLLRPGSCPSCPQGGYRLAAAHMELYFTEACEIRVTLSLVPAMGQPGCLAPNPFAPPICPPTEYVINDRGQFDECVDYALAMPGGCCIDGPVFLVIEFDPGSCRSGRPGFCGPAACSNCTQYNFYPGVNSPGDDLCTVLTAFSLTPPIMYVDADCCAPTSTLPRSWGTLKTLYR